MPNPQLQKDFEQAQAAHKQIVLSASEKVALKNRIFAEIEELTAVDSVAQPVRSPFMTWSFYLRAVPVVVLVFVLIGAPIAFAAERSLPGDALYSLKTNVNEEVVAVFVSREEKDEYYQNLLTKRAGELRVLMKRGELDDKRLADFEKVLEKNVHVAIETSARSEESPEEILQDHQAIVATLEMSAEGFGLPDDEVDPAILETIDDSHIGGVPVVKMAVVELDVVDTSAVSIEKSELQKRFGTLKTKAESAFLERVAEVSGDSLEETRATVERLVEDAREKVDAIVRENAEDVESDQQDDAREDAENVELATDVEEVKARVSATTTVGVSSLEEVLELHERLSRKKITRDVERLVEELSELEDEGIEIVLPITVEVDALPSATSSVPGL